MVLWAIKWKWYGGSFPEKPSAGQRSRTNYLTEMPAISWGGDPREDAGERAVQRTEKSSCWWRRGRRSREGDKQASRLLSWANGSVGVNGGRGGGVYWCDSPLTPASISALQDVDHIFQMCPFSMPLRSESEVSGLLVKGVGSHGSLRISRNKQRSPGIRKILGIRDLGGFDPAIYSP